MGFQSLTVQACVPEMENNMKGSVHTSWCVLWEVFSVGSELVFASPWSSLFVLLVD